MSNDYTPLDILCPIPQGRNADDMGMPSPIMNTCAHDFENTIKIGPVLVGCEESQVLCKAFREEGYEAYSCDLEETRGNPNWHYRQDIMEVIPSRHWPLIILHPDCTAMAVSGNRWYGQGRLLHHERINAVKWTIELWKLAKQYSDHAALENPNSVIFPRLNAPRFYLQPHDHGHGETKKTGFALHNLQPIPPTNKVDGREQRVWKMPPSATRKRDRSETYEGVARAIVKHWGVKHCPLCHADITAEYLEWLKKKGNEK